MKTEENTSNKQVSTKQKMLQVKLGTPDLSVVTLTIENYTAETVSLKYSGLPGNLPNTYKNFVAIWNQTIIPWGRVDPIQQQTIPTDIQSGTVVLTGVTITASSYVIGYGCGANITDIAASAILSAGGLRATPTSVAIGINAVGNNSVSLSYNTLSGYQPEKYGNWVGIWEGYYSPYNDDQPLGSVKIDSNSSQGNVAINGLTLGVNSEYTLVYFMDAGFSTAAAILNFNTSDYQ